MSAGRRVERHHHGRNGAVVAGAWLVALVKPQFEAGREAVGKGGIVRDPDAREAALARVEGCVAGLEGWTLIGATASPITGQDGNAEWLLAARRET